MNLVLFTSHYPFEGSNEQTFLKEEIQYLSKTFEHVILIPRTDTGKIISLPRNVSVEKTYAKFLENPIKAFVIPQLVFSPFFYREISRQLWLLFSPSSLFHLITFLGGAYLTQHWLVQWINERRINPKETIFYTYWFDQPAFGIGMTKRLFPDLKLVSRAHGYDLYPERYSPAYLPLRNEAFEMIDFLFPDSEIGTNYLVNQYPQFKTKFETARLGVAESGFITNPSSDNVFRMVSCSLLVPVKRVNLLLDALYLAAKMRPEQQFIWHHFGNGNTREVLQTYANENLPQNARAYFPGYESNQALMNFYQNSPVDVFFNVSASEGTPVAIMEAISCGIPIIATAVGGNQEIVSKENGWLLSANPSPKEIAETMFQAIDNPEQASLKRQGSLSIWRKRYHAKTNFEDFIFRIKSL
ncbi:MAG: glycosyltransferase [Anaerolineales bacterium]|nr:glycosyltransferase [Anaerolineales bacterium]